MVAVFLLALFIDPVRAPWLPACPLHEWTGLYCPGCGATRAMHQLVHGHLAAAFRLNPLAILALPGVGYLWVRREPLAMKPIWIWVLVGAMLVFGVVRNVPAYPFTLLAP